MPTLSSLKDYIPTITTSVADYWKKKSALDSANSEYRKGLASAVDRISKGAEESRKTMADVYGDQRNILAPYRAAGESGLPTLQEGIAPGGEFNKPFTMADFDLYKDPGFQFRIQEGERAIKAGAMHGGTRFSGATLKALSRFNQDAASQEANNAFNRYQTDLGGRFSRLRSGIGIGENAAQQEVAAGSAYGANLSKLTETTAAQLAELDLMRADAEASGDIASANAFTDLITGLLEGIDSVGTGNALEDLFNKYLGGDMGTGTRGTAPPGPGDLGERDKIKLFPPPPPPIPPPYIPPPGNLQIPPPPSDLITGPGNIPPNPPTDDLGLGNRGPVVPPPVPPPLGPPYIPPPDLDIPAPPTELMTPPGESWVGGLPSAPSTLSQAAPLIGGTTLASALPFFNPATVSSALPLTAAPAELMTAAGAPLTGGVASGGGGGAMGAITGFLTNPITIAVGAALGIGALWLKSQAHHEANTWVQNFQNPFDDRMEAIDQQHASGLISGEEAIELRKANMEDYFAAMREFESRGSDERKVVQQSRDTFLKYYAPYYNEYGVSF